MHFTPKQKLAELRRLLEEHNLDAYVIPTADAHNSENPVEADERRAYISGFTGSAGSAFIGRAQAWLRTDGRYFIQAQSQLDPEDWVLLKDGLPETPSLETFLKENGIERLGFDPFLHSQAEVDGMRKFTVVVPIHAGYTAEKAADLEILQNVSAGQMNLVDLVWNKDGNRPEYPKAPLVVVSDKFAGETVESKLARIRKVMTESNASLQLVTSLDEIVWVLNIRGSDSSHDRVALSYLLITNDSALLYLQQAGAPGRLDNVKTHFEATGVTVRPYGEFLGDVFNAARGTDKQVLIPNTANFAITAAVSIETSKRVSVKQSAVQVMKSVKNKEEMNGMRRCHVADGAALAYFFSWLTSLPMAELSQLSEVDVMRKVTEFRRGMKGYVMDSFTTIAGVNANGAIVHYEAQPGTAAKLDGRGMLLVDSGGHYEDGTTDVTRTVHLGMPTLWQKELYTRVLQGHVDLASTIFPKRAALGGLDSIARRPLWQIGLDYNHGTGHGVGHSIAVHEMPPAITSKFQQPAEPGMVVSNEPGVYIEGQFGIRIENVVMVKMVDTAHKFNYETSGYLGFEELTMFPYARGLIDKSMLSSKEIDYINAYHAETLNKVSNEIRSLPNAAALGDPAAVLKWLDLACAPL